MHDIIVFIIENPLFSLMFQFLLLSHPFNLVLHSHYLLHLIFKLTLPLIKLQLLHSHKSHVILLLQLFITRAHLGQVAALSAGTAEIMGD